MRNAIPMTVAALVLADADLTKARTAGWPGTSPSPRCPVVPPYRYFNPCLPPLGRKGPIRPLPSGPLMAQPASLAETARH